MPVPNPAPAPALDAAALAQIRRDLNSSTAEWTFGPLSREWVSEKMRALLAEVERLAAENTFTPLCADVLAWQAATFPHRTPHSITEHLRREAEELAKEPTDAEELADVGLLLIAAADASGVDLIAAIRAKLEKNKLRKWGEPDAHGVVSHVPMPAPPQEARNA